MKKLIFAFLFITALSDASLLAQKNENKLKGTRVLVFTKNGKGYVHDNIPASVAAFQKLGTDNGFVVDTTTNSALFTDDYLKKYDALIFSNSNNDVFDTEAQKVAFMRYIQAGGGFMGIHSAIGTERKWKWFKMMMGATFLRHPPIQKFTVHVLDKQHPAMKGLVSSWETSEECYYFKEINPSIKVLMYADLSAIKEPDSSKFATPDVFGNRYPSAWCHEFDGGRIFYTALGHDKSNYSNDIYLALILTGLKWVVDKPKPDYRRSKATSSAVNEMIY
jgi:type 1 glutamine amidotransferase